MGDRDLLELIRVRAFELSRTPASGTPEQNWLQAEHELAVAYEYDTAEHDLERLGLKLSRLPSEAGVVWRLILPRGEVFEGWEPGNHGLDPPRDIATLLDVAVESRPLQPAPPASDDPGAVRLCAMLQRQRESLLAHDPGVRIGMDPDNLRRHRVAARRARAFVRATQSSLDEHWRRSLVASLRALGDATGPVRDLDVLLAHVREEVRFVSAVDRAGANLLVARLEGHATPRANSC